MRVGLRCYDGNAVQSASEPILDYASPRKYSRVRMPAVSELSFAGAGPGHVCVTETLKGRDYAVKVIIFACIVLVILSTLGTTQLFQSKFIVFDSCLVGIPWVGLVTTLIAVIHQTWRKTVIEVREGVLTLTFSSVFKQQVFAWRASDLSMNVVTTHLPEVGPSLGELQLQSSEYPLVKLLTDHLLSEVQHVQQLLRTALEGGEFKPPKPVTIERDPKNLERLVQLQRDIRRKRAW